MRERFIFTFLFHLFGISLFLIPNNYQGPVVMQIFGFNMRAIDALALILMVGGTVFLYVSLFLCLSAQVKLTRQSRSDNCVDKARGPNQ